MSYLPFGIGPRACTGRVIAEYEIKVILIHVVMGLELSFEDENHYAVFPLLATSM